MTPQEFKEIRNVQQVIIDRAEKIINTAFESAMTSSLPENLRPATSKDIIEGAIIWYKHGDNGHFWQIVENVLRPSDPYKAYCAEDGCRYGLDDAWIEVQQ